MVKLSLITPIYFVYLAKTMYYSYSMSPFCLPMIALYIVALLYRVANTNNDIQAVVDFILYGLCTTKLTKSVPII